MWHVLIVDDSSLIHAMYNSVLARIPSSRITHAKNGLVTVTTARGAVCIAWAWLPNESFSSAPALWEPRTADAAGNASWTYDADAGSGTGILHVRCTIDNETRQAARSYSLR